MRSTTTVRLIGGPTLVIGVGGLRLLTDPADGRPGPIGAGPIDVVLLSRDTQDGHELLAQVPLVLTTSVCTERLGRSARALPPWYHLSLPRPDGGELRITGVPAQPGPGEVTGFVLSGVDTPAIYLSGGTVSPDVAEAVAQRCPQIDIAVLPADGALTGDQAAAILGSPTVILT
ncbi:MBL fold metallo-hydrolase [Amycolatopsis sp. NBC_01480]|uniref:MBL fold metallo-hydrolase n=1 Tax=Amycolatopsis sp. NBC_01480 TaxID=2903562 RepID=UPI002E2E7CBE|nr:MBL fold metallo-hydrolase [Amycolatopsis sp. NBC_01480]